MADLLYSPTTGSTDSNGTVVGRTQSRVRHLVVVGSSALTVGVVASTWGPRRDVDYWWRVLLGEELLRGSGEELGAWTTFGGDPAWQTTQILGDVSIALLDAILPIAGPVFLRATAAGSAMVVLIWLLQPWRPHAQLTRLLAIACGAITIAGFTQERPASMVFAMFPLAGVLAGRLLRGLTEEDRLPDSLLSASLVVGGVWILLHPSWILPLFITAAALIVKAGTCLGRRLLVFAWLLAISALLLSTGLWHRSMRISAAGSQLAEWQRTDITEVAALPLVAVGVIWAIWCYARRTLPDRALACALLLLAVVGVTSWRFVAPVVLMALGLLATALAADAQRQRIVSHTDRLSTITPLAAAMGTTLLLTLMADPHRIHSPSDHVVELAQIAECMTADPVVIAAHYDDHGAALYGARRSGCAGSDFSRVALDGRADRYGSALIDRWQRAVTAGSGWESAFQIATPTHAVLPVTSALTHRLAETQWIPMSCQGRYVLFRQPISGPTATAG